MILGIETSGAYASVAVMRGEILLGERVYLAEKRVCSTLTPEIRQLLLAEGLDAGRLEAVGVSRGPGSFTSLRVGVATANALGQALGIPVVGISTLEVIAHSTLLPKGSEVAAACPSRKTEVYVQKWRNQKDGWEAEGMIRPVELSRLGEEVKAMGTDFLAGEEARRWLKDQETVCQAMDVIPRASQVALLAWKILSIGKAPSEAKYVLPIYIRRSQPEEKGSF